MLSAKKPVAATSSAIVSGSRTISFARVARAAGTSAPTVISTPSSLVRRPQLDDDGGRLVDDSTTIARGWISTMVLEPMRSPARTIRAVDDRKPPIGRVQNRCDDDDPARRRPGRRARPRPPPRAAALANGLRGHSGGRTRSTSGGAGTVVGIDRRRRPPHRSRQDRTPDDSRRRGLGLATGATSSSPVA